MYMIAFDTQGRSLLSNTFAIRLSSSIGRTARLRFIWFVVQSNDVRVQSEAVENTEELGAPHHHPSTSVLWILNYLLRITLSASLENITCLFSLLNSLPIFLIAIMPNYEVEHTTPLTPQQQDALAEAITKIHTEKFSAPSLFVNVRFTDIFKHAVYVAGKRVCLHLPRLSNTMGFRFCEQMHHDDTDAF